MKIKFIFVSSILITLLTNNAHAYLLIKNIIERDKYKFYFHLNTNIQSLFHCQ